MTKRDNKDMFNVGCVFEDNPFIDGFGDWMQSQSGQLSREVSDAVWDMLEQVDVDAKNRKIIWDDGQRLSIDESVDRISKKYREYPAGLIAIHLIAWLEVEFAPEHYSPEQLDELDALTAQWVFDHHKRIRAD